jgi:glyoxylase-like metal-dependent hydrolase (beta-lactamase superfamily II)
MTTFICMACGFSLRDLQEPPTSCHICSDDRQYVPASGQRWSTRFELGATHTVRMDDDDGVLGFGIDPGFGIDQRAAFVPTRRGNIFWEALSLVTDSAVHAIRALGGVDAIAVSHPHFYAAMADWSDALDAPILLHEADRSWVRNAVPRIEFWSGARLRLNDSLTLIHCPGHFPGSSVLHWREGPDGTGALFSGDSLQVAADRKHVSFMYSYPNAIPMNPDSVRSIQLALAGVEFDRVYGYTWGRNIVSGARDAVDRSFHRYLRAVTPSVPEPA